MTLIGTRTRGALKRAGYAGDVSLSVWLTLAACIAFHAYEMMPGIYTPSSVFAARGSRDVRGASPRRHVREMSAQQRYGPVGSVSPESFPGGRFVAV